MRIYTPPNSNPIPPQAEVVFKGEIFTVYQWPQTIFDGSVETFEMLKRPDSVEIIALVEDKILISREIQPHTKTFIGIPAGRHDVEGENELEAAKRELREETGHTFKNWKLVYARQSSGKIDQIIYTFLATELDRVGEQQLDAGEKIEVLKYSFAEFKAMKFDPLTRSYPSNIMEQIDSIEDLISKPTLHNYDNQD